MCFSAGASFGASAVLGIVGIATIKKIRAPGHAPFASIPLLLAGQQAAEGMLWIRLSSTDHAPWKNLPVYIFLIFAQLVWPVWVPFSILKLENDRTRRKILKAILAMGSCGSLYLMYCLIAYDVDVELHSGHILYTLDFPMAFEWVSSVFYFIPTVFPLFISSIKRVPLLGAGLLASFIFAKFFFAEHLISVWCFFAAILSVVIFWITSKFRNSQPVL